MRLWTSRTLSLALLVAASFAGAQTAIPASAVPEDVSAAAVCPPTNVETLLEVRVAGVNRGTFLVREALGRTWIQRTAFRQGEERYFDAELRCDEVPFARLRSGISTQTDLEQLTLSFEPQLELLGSQEFTVTAPAPERLLSLPLLGLDYRLSGSTDLNLKTQQNGEFRVNYTQDAFSGFAGLRESLGQGGVFALSSYARARYQADPQFAAQLVYNLPAVVGLGQGNLLGAQAFIQGGLTRYWPVFEFVLPLEADLRLIANGKTLKTWRSAPGKVTLRNIPLEGNRGNFSVEIQDEAGKRSIGEGYDYPDTLLPQGGYIATLEGGLLADDLYGGTAFRVGLLPELTLEGRGAFSSTLTRGELWAVLAPPRQSLRLGLSFDSSSVKSAPFAARANYNVSIFPFSLGVSAVIPLQDSFAPSLGVNALFNAGSFDVSAQSNYESDGRGLSNRLSVDIRLNEQLSLSPFISQQGDNITVGIGATFRPESNLSGSISAVKPSSSNPAFNAGVQYQPDPQNGFSVSTDFQSLSASYRYTNQFDFDISANSTGAVSAQLGGSVALVGSNIYFSRSGNASRYVLLQTGVPDLPIYAEGQYQGSTNADGNLVLALVTSENTQIRVDLNSLPIDLTVRQEKRDIELSNPGTYVVDWRDNFVRSRFVEFRLDAQTLAIRGQIEFVGADTLYLDDFGMGFLPISKVALEGTLISEEGGKRCPIRIEPDATSITCSSSPP